MAFDLSTAQPVTEHPVASKFDISTAVPVAAPAPPVGAKPGDKYPGSDGQIHVVPYQTDSSNEILGDMSGPQKFAAGMGQSVVDTGKGLAQVAGLRNKSDVDEDRRIDAPLDSTGAGIAGNLAGGAAMFALPGIGAARALGAAAKMPGLIGVGAKVAAALAPEAGGALIGGLAPVDSAESRLRNAAFGAAAGAAGSELGKTAQSVLRSGVDAIPSVTRSAYGLAQKYGIDLSVPQLSNSTFLRHYSNLTDALPFSGADARAATQRAQFNDAVGKVSGIPKAEGAITPDLLDDAKDQVGGMIGNVASQHSALPTQSNLRGMMNVVDDARANATPANQAAVEAKVQQLLTHVDPNTGVIPGPAWRQANTALQRQIRSETDGDLKYYLGGLQDHFMDMMEQGIPPATFDAWQGLRGQYRNLKSIEPLVEKGGNTGISPALLRQRLITAKNNRGNLSDLADLGQEQIKASVPNSGTAQKNIIAGATGLGGGAAVFGHPGPLIAVGVNSLANRGLNSNLAAKYYMSRLPDGIARVVDPALESLAPGAAVLSGTEGDQRDTAMDSLSEAGKSGALVGHAAGGAVSKPTFWDLAQQVLDHSQR